MPTRFHVAAKELRGPIGAYAKRFDLLEVHVGPAPQAGARGALETVPALATLRRWRKQVPPHFDFSVVGGAALSRVKPGAALDRDVTAANAAVAALQARCLVVRTVPDVTPGAVWRERLGALFARFPRDATNIVWEPSGLWEIDDAAVAAKKWGVVLAVDAARDPVPSGPVAYARLRALGETRSFGESALERIVRKIGARRDAFVVLETDGALAECKSLRRVAQRAKAGAEGGMGRLVRPRGGIVVGDDEQE
jgi:uncharacterized protein YecE (DUF72 family)